MIEPLRDVTVVEFKGLGPAPFAAMCLADMGATVFQIGRAVPEKPPLWLDRKRTAMALDLKSEDGKGKALELIARADILIEGFRPGKMEALGLGPDACFAVNPRLVYGRMTGWGQEGPMAHIAGHDLNFLAMSGLLSLMGHADRPPTPPLNLISDFGGGGMYLALGLVCALYGTRASGKGCVVDAAMLHGTNHLATFVYGRMAEGTWMQRRESNALDGGAPFYRVYECAGGGWMAVAAVETPFWRNAVETLGLDTHMVERQWDRGDWPAQIEAVAGRFATRRRDEWTAVFDGVDACVTPVLSVAEATAHPQAARYFEAVDGIARPLPAPIFKEAG